MEKSKEKERERKKQKGRLLFFSTFQSNITETLKLLIRAFLSSSITSAVRNHRYSVNIKTPVRKIIALDRTSQLSTSTLVNVSNRLRDLFSPLSEKTSNRFQNPFVTTTQNKNHRSFDSFNIKNDTQTLIKRQKLLSL